MADYMNKYQNNFNRGKEGKQVEEREELKLEVIPEEFESVSKGKLITTTKLANKINKIFKPVIAGYEGCSILPDVYGKLSLKIYIKDVNVNNDKIKCIEPYVNSNNQSMGARVMNINRRNANKVYKLTKEAMELLGRFTQYGNDKKKVDWNRIVTEQPSQPYSSYNSYIIYVVIELDLLKVIKAIWGAKNKQLHTKYEYILSVVKPLSATQTDMMCSDWLLSIQQLDVNEIEKVASDVGLVPSVGALPIIR